MKVFDRAVVSDVLRTGIDGLKLQLTEAQIEKLLDYLALLNKWNAVYNLTSVRDPLQMVTLHLLDSLAAVAAFKGAKNVPASAASDKPCSACNLPSLIKTTASRAIS